MSTFYDVAPDPDGGLLRISESLTDPLEFSYRLQFEPGPVDRAPELHWYAGGDRVPDWTFTINSMRLVSARVKDILDAHAGSRDDIQWLPATVTTTDGKDHPYWVAHFPTWHDILNQERTSFGPNGMPIKAVLAPSKLEGLNVFIVPRRSDNVIVRDTVRQALEAAHITGCLVQPACI